jgi:hypothetical protein
MSRCDETFHEWFSKAYSKLPEGEDFPVDVEFMYYVWKACWSRAYGVGQARGQHQMVIRYRQKEERKVTPMSYIEMESLFKQCSSGRDFGRLVERWHGIKGDIK